MASLDSTQDRTRAEIATYLREFADELDPGHQSDSGRNERTHDTGTQETDIQGTDMTTGTSDRDQSQGSNSSVGEKVTVIAGNESATINPPQTCTFDVAIDTDSDLLDTGAERSTTFTIRWDAEQVEADDELSVE
ncbi:hypothetical protein CV102_20990 [Natronococcus pandeyae]|uniref:Amphi-Trp domain-containing protein n=1 Tax=Natronococcus pandeyae TaxID=2055836 RepID=A0A8J8Q1M1_9EURY|nr:hypothetical protein [Natronococcus pandeyae]TYL36753.1 hypothetical protein CV102_20990 [Natronococcus pandeyae]